MNKIKLSIDFATLEFINHVLWHIGDNQSATNQKDKALISIARDLFEKFKISPFSSPQKIYKKKIKYHEAYFLLMMIGTFLDHSSDPYMSSIGDLLRNEIQRQL